MTFKYRRAHKPPPSGSHTNALLDTASGMAIRAEGAPDPFNLRIEVRKPRRSQGSKQKKKPGIFYIGHGDDWKSTRIPETQPERAQAFLDGVRAQHLNEVLGRVMPGALTFATLLADHVANVHASATTDPAEATTDPPSNPGMW